MGNGPYSRWNTSMESPTVIPAVQIILIAFPVLLLSAVAFLAVIAVGIRKGDRRDLASPAVNRIEAIARRVTGVGTRSSGHGDS
jgi:hypothetical protein